MEATTKNQETGAGDKSARPSPPALPRSRRRSIAFWIIELEALDLKSIETNCRVSREVSVRVRRMEHEVVGARGTGGEQATRVLPVSSADHTMVQCNPSQQEMFFKETVFTRNATAPELQPFFFISLSNTRVNNVQKPGMEGKCSKTRGHEDVASLIPLQGKDQLRATLTDPASRRFVKHVCSSRKIVFVGRLRWSQMQTP
ncbi:hypothetical protein TRIUR3_13268 [Triticum urartu]|uniref:Uncharacterized protein n=1 Tax=Triticum urartu TaxID=4572 RepID=M7Y7I6_TRIUA|nr:hypothetical protein TRIUR3_13268 [Triticum urartu]